MKKILVYIVSLSMLLSNNAMIMAADKTATAAEVQDCTQSKKDSATKDKRGTLKKNETVSSEKDDVVNIPDKYILNAMMEQGDKNNDGYLTKEELESVTSIYISNAKENEVDFTGLEYATNLRYIQINHAKKINHLEQLIGLKKLQGLDIPGVTDSDMKYISQLGQLTSLTISGEFKNINGLEQLKNLNYLRLESEALENIQELKNLTNLETLDIEACKKIKDISFLKKRAYTSFEISENIPADQILDYEDFKNSKIQEGTSLTDLEAPISMSISSDDEDSWVDDSTFIYDADNTNVIDEDGHAVGIGETDVTISVNGRKEEASKKIHVKVQNGSNIEPAGQSKDQLPTLTKGQLKDRKVNMSTVYEDGNAYDLTNGGKKVASDAKSYVANYVYSGDNYFILKNKISKSGDLYTGLETGELQKQNFDVKKVDRNYFITNNKELYRINEKNQAEKIDEDVEDILAFDYYGYKGKCLILHSNGDLTEVKNEEFKIQNIKRIASKNCVVQRNGAMLYINWDGTDFDGKNITSKRISDTEMTVLQIEYNRSEQTLFMKENVLYIYDGGKLYKIADNVKRVVTESEHVYESLEGDYYSFEDNWDDDDKLFYSTKKINCTDTEFTGVTKDGTAYIEGKKILTDVVSCGFYSYYRNSQYFMVRKDGTIWKYESPYLAEKVLNYDGEKVEPTPTPTPSSGTTASSNAEPQQIKVNKISFSAISTKIAAGKKIKLTTLINPQNATNKTLKWTTSNNKLATVDKNGVVTLNKKAGGKTVKITAEATDGSGQKATFTIKIMKGSVKKITISGKKTVKAGKTLKLKAKVTASKGANKTLKWTSSNTKYATVSSGKVKALKAGKKKSVKITAMATDGSGKSKTVTIKIK